MKKKKKNQKNKGGGGGGNYKISWLTVSGCSYLDQYTTRKLCFTYVLRLCW